MSQDLVLTLIEAFDHFFGASAFRVCKISDDEALLVGNGFGLLTSVDRDGLSMWYLDLDSKKNELVDIGGYLATQRKWHLDESIALEGNIESQRLRGLRSFAKTLFENGKDVMSGDKTWLKSVRTRPVPISPSHLSKILDAILKSS